MQIIDLTELFKSDKEFLSNIDKLDKSLKEFKKYEGKLFLDGKTLYEFLSFDTDFSKELEKSYIYAHINSDLDLTNNKYNMYVGKMLNLFNKYEEITSFVIPEILEKDYQDFAKLLKEYSALKEYERNIKHIFRNKKIIRNKEEEKLISILTSSYNKPEQISGMLINTDLDYGFFTDENGKKIKLTNSNYSTYLESSDRRVRKEVFDHLYDEISSHENTFATILNNQIINDNRIAKIRNFKSARALSLYSNEVYEKIYDNLIEGVHKNLPKFYKYYEFKQKVLDLKDFHIYDTYANITKEYNKKYSYNEAKNIILSSLSILGDDYIKVLKSAFDNYWLDTRVLDNKRSGAYCTACYLTHPYVVSSYEGKLEDISTLAHELGHAMHYYYAIENNTYQDYGYSIFVAEVASQVNEIILTDYVYKNSNDVNEKKYLLDQMLNRFKATIVRQTMFAEFEMLLHEKEQNGEILTKELITNLYYDLNKNYFGKNVTSDEKIKYECFRIPHFYYNFYVYQYATGYAAAMKIANDIISGKAGAKENYLKFLTLGCTKDPVSSLKVAGVDISDKKVIDDVFKVFENKLNELRNLYE